MNYNYIAPFYDSLSRIYFLNQQQKAHQILLKHLKSGDKILWLGGGSGWFLKGMDNLNLQLNIDFVELSSVMINKARTREVKNIKINFIRQDILTFDVKSNYNMIITAFIFDHFNESDCQLIFKKINPNLIKEGKWIFIDFVENQNFVQRFLTQLMVLFFKIVAGIRTKDFPKIESLFNAFDIIEERKYFFEYIVSRVYRK